MNTVDYPFQGRTLRLAFTADLLFRCYEKWGMEDDLVSAMKLREPSVEGWKNLCELAAMMAAQGELQRRAAGFEREPMVDADALRYSIPPSEANELRAAVIAAMAEGFRRHVPDPDAEQEVNLVLRDRETEEVKKKAPAIFEPSFWWSLVQDCISALQTPSSSAPESTTTSSPS